MASASESKTFEYPIVFTGVVTPERACVRAMNHTIPLGTASPVSATVSVKYSQVNVRVESGPVNVELYDLKEGVRDLVQGDVDVVGFLKGCAYTVEISTAVSANGLTQVFPATFRSDVPKDEAIKQEYDECYQLVWQSHELRRSLANIRLAILHPLDTSFFALRAIEAIRKYFETDDPDSKKSWIVMGAKLDIDQNWTKSLEDAAQEARHGGLVILSRSEREQAIDKANIVIRKFIEFLNSKLAV